MLLPVSSLIHVLLFALVRPNFFNKVSGLKKFKPAWNAANFTPVPNAQTEWSQENKDIKAEGEPIHEWPQEPANPPANNDQQKPELPK